MRSEFISGIRVIVSPGRSLAASNKKMDCSTMNEEYLFQLF